MVEGLLRTLEKEIFIDYGFLFASGYEVVLNNSLFI